MHDKDAILVVNAGSSSIKFSVFDAAASSVGKLLYRGQAEGVAPMRFRVRDAQDELVAEETLAAPADGAFEHHRALNRVLTWLQGLEGGATLVAAGHRIVHGGPRFAAPVCLTPEVMEELERLIPLAPLHQPHNLAAIRALGNALPDLLQVACFDTAFHRTQPAIARALALPRELSAAGLERYGFHGLSCEHIVGVLPDYLRDAARLRVVIAHLGNGASLTAVREGASVATTMGLTALDGLVMGTRPGLLDPGVLLYLSEHKNMDQAALTDLLYHRSGLLGVSGVSSDMRVLLEEDSAAAREAVDLFVYRIGRELGSLAAALGGLDALVLTAGIGEHSATIRARVCAGARWLGLTLDEEANAAGGPRITTQASRVSAWVIPTDEERVIARHTARLMAGAGTTRAE